MDKHTYRSTDGGATWHHKRTCHSMSREAARADAASNAPGSFFRPLKVFLEFLQRKVVLNAVKSEEKHDYHCLMHI